MAACMLSLLCHSQSTIDSIVSRLNVPQFSSLVDQKAKKIESKIISKSERILVQLQKQELKIYRRQLRTKDSLFAKEKIKDIELEYARLRQGMHIKSTDQLLNASPYDPYLDTLQTTFKFLDRHDSSGSCSSTLSTIQSLQGKFQQSEQIKTFIKSRRDELKQMLEKTGAIKQLKKYSKAVQYYSDQLKEYKSTLADPKKIEKKAIDLLCKTKLFKDFLKRNSMLASLFRTPDNAGMQTSLAGLQTRAQINSLIQQQIAVGGAGAQQQISQNIQAAQAQLTQIKDKVLKAGGHNVDDELPDFKRNQQKTKSFWKRLEYGTNIQTQKATTFFPVTSDVGLTLGYKLNDKSIVGIGTSYKMGWGSGWRDLTITHEGVSLRSFVDYKLKGSFWITGGYEMNYRSSFTDIEQLQDLNGWQQSGLIGITKIVAVKNKFFKKTKLQLLWDFISYRQLPRTQPLTFRIGYSFK